MFDVRYFSDIDPDMTHHHVFFKRKFGRIPLYGKILTRATPGVMQSGFVWVFCLIAWTTSMAQISPGELSRAHRSLEGISNCTQCHDLGSKVSNTKCLQCHKEIKTQLDKRTGYHYSKDIRGKDCASCHSDHNGLNFDMVRFDEKNFNHALTGYELTGTHARTDCRDCHQPEKIADAKLKNRKNTYLGLQRHCTACHSDPHQTTLGNDCARCHNTSDFSPASKFDHAKTDFPLTGQHQSVNCLECHIKETRNGVAYQRFAGVPFKNCNSCHQDPHRDNLGTNCKECHVVASFSSQSVLNRFNHSKTAFPLKGAHKKIDCRDCHQMNTSPVLLFQDKKGIPTQQCASCHRDVHEGKLGNSCADCHNENAFQSAANTQNFDHNRTNFALKGQHQTVDCRKCHVSDRMTDPVAHNTCASCHKDYHNNEFAANGISPDCAQCHTVDGFSGSLFTLEQHAKTSFPLDGGHAATPCIACHVKQEKWTFRNIGKRCVDCHQDVHAGTLDAKWYPEQDCALCHATSGWIDNRFDHSKTAFPLAGAHMEQACSACHLREGVFPYGQFKGLASSCATCHDDVHAQQFARSGATDCARCHRFEDWKIPSFDHDRTAFRLEGKHASVDCNACHKPQLIDGKQVVQYQLNRFECIDCHQ